MLQQFAASTRRPPTFYLFVVVARGGVEPPTFRFSGPGGQVAWVADLSPASVVRSMWLLAF